MRNRTLHTLFLATLLTGSAIYGYAQDAQGLYSLEEVTPGGQKFISNYYPKYIPRLQWIGDRCTYLEGDKLMESNAKEQSPKVLLTVSEIQNLITGEDLLHMYHGQLPHYYPIEGEPSLLAVQTWRAIYIIDLSQKKLLRSLSLQNQGDTADALVELSPDAKWLIARSNDGTLYMQQLEEAGSDKRTQRLVIAQNEGDTIVYGESVHQREFGIEKGIFWSPDGSKVAFYRMDQSMVAPYPLVDITPHKAKEVPVRYPMAGEPSHHVTLGVFDRTTGQTVYMQTGGDPEHYLTNIAWDPDNRSLYIAEVNRGQNHNEVNRYDAQSGARLATLFVEDDPKYIEPQSPMIFLPANDGRYLWLSRKDGYNHFYLGSTRKANSLQQITRGEWEVTEFKGFSQDGKTIFFEATAASPLETRLYSIGINGKNFVDLTPIEGVHRTSLNASKTAFIDTYSSPSTPRISRIVSTKGKEEKQLLKAEDPTKNAVMPEITLGTLTAHDGKTTLHYRLLKPINFDPNKKYPTIIYVYGGPHAQLVAKDWLAGAGGWDVYMAQQGYVVFTLDNRGSARRGRDFEQVIHRQVGTAEMDDQMRGVEFLQQQPWVDTERIGVYGWSFGGFMTTNLMLTHSDVFKVGVAGGPVMDWSRYEVMYGERYNDTPQENPEGYKKNDLTRRAGDLKGRLLLIHGTVDNVVLWQHAQAFVQACINQRTYPDCMYYPGHEHNVLGKDRVHLNQTITRYFQDHL